MQPKANSKPLGRRRLTIGAVLASVSLLSIGGAALSGFPGMPEAAQKAHAAPAKKKKAKGESEVVVFEPFVVALPGQSTARSLRLRFAVAIDTKVPDDVLAEKLQLRDEFLAVVYELDTEKLRTRGGFRYLRDELTTTAKTRFGEKCGALLLTEFIIL
ncbi:flagellar basal body-associated FliL family protein [Parvularcula maris]|uniref:Flagellar protein FliL n=1 Tax=Parvularcula maris TaxID=2965077 RepID=A0A9X2RGK4_9PROT|nr:flagellar basal body-associated FliL family protein [Parvularcula maris]MCQ8184065.1 flagellar basal body-associated FliL family protein [Parvularcula maris]